MKQQSIQTILSTLRGKSPRSIVITLGLMALVYYFSPREAKKPDAHAAARGIYTGVCVKVLDGDTIDVRADSGEEFRLRLLGVDCMETYNQDKMAEQSRRLNRSMEEIERLGLRAKNRTRELVLNQQVSWLVPEGTPLFDPYERLLAYVERSGSDVGEQLLREGLAEVRRDRHPREDIYRKVVVSLAR